MCAILLLNYEADKKCSLNIFIHSNIRIPDNKYLCIAQKFCGFKLIKSYQMYPGSTQFY